MSFNRLEQDLYDLNGKYRFVDIHMSAPAWTEEDDVGVLHHHTVDIHLSNYGHTTDDPFYTFDDIPLAACVSAVHRKECG